MPENDAAHSTAKIPAVQLKLEQALVTEFGEALRPRASLAWKEYGLTFELDRDSAYEIFQKLRNDPQFLFDMLIDVTCVDWMDKRENRFEILYHLLSTKLLHRLCIRIQCPEDKPEVESVRPLWASANFMEREVWDMFGIDFIGHGDLRRILMYDEFVGHPLRKDYPVRQKQPRVKLRVPELHNASADMRKEQLVALPVRQRMG